MLCAVAFPTNCETRRGNLTPCAYAQQICSLRFSVLFWGSHPDQENDDLDHVIETNDPNEAFRTFFAPIDDNYVEYVELDGFSDAQLAKLGISRLRKNPTFRKSNPSTDTLWQRESAMQAGMAFGCDGYNDAMGY